MIDPQDGRLIPLQVDHSIIVYGTLLERQKLVDTSHLALIGWGTVSLAMWLEFLVKVLSRKASN
jgi:hypothetical protein